MERSTFWFVLCLCAAALSATCWMVGTGSLSDRVVVMNIKRAASEPTIEEILSRLADARSALSGRETWLQRFSFLIRTQDRTSLDRARRTLTALENTARELLEQEGSDPQGAGVETFRQTLRDLQPLYTDAFLPEHRTAWAVAFWVSLISTFILALLLFIKRT